MLDIPTAQANRKARRATTTTTPTTGLTPQPEVPGATSVTPTSTTANPWMSYNEYFAGKPEAADASKYSMYHATPGYESDPSRWPGGVDPYSFSNEYNQYRESLPLIYQDLINYGVSPESVASGQMTSLNRSGTPEKIPTDPAEAMAIYGTTRGAAVGAPGGPTSASGPIPGGVGSGSSHTLDPNIISRMWR